MKSVIVVGAGAAGLIAAVNAARNGSEVTIIDSNQKIGRKILATGNGRCNYSNTDMSIDKFRTVKSKNNLIIDTLKRFGTDELTGFFESLGMVSKNINGYLYPNSEQAASVVDLFSYELKRLKVNIVLEERIVDVRKNNNGFLVIGSLKTYLCDSVIITVGGLASPNLGSDGNLYPTIKRLGHTFTEMYPALTALNYKDTGISKLAGVRIKCAVYFCVNDLPAYKESGEIIINKDNIGGIPVMQLSTYYHKHKKDKISLMIDLFDHISDDEMYDLINKRIFGLYSSGKTVYECLTGMMNNKLLDYLIRNASINPDKKASTLRPNDINKLIEVFKGFKIVISDVCGYEKAQVTAGGIPLSEIDRNFMSKKLKNLYLAGEVLDVDGTCGGYNLQWAFSSGYIAGENAAK